MKRHDKANPNLPKGAYRLPNGNYVTVGKWAPADQSGKRQIRIVAVHKDPPDIEKLARAFLYLAEELGKQEGPQRD